MYHEWTIAKVTHFEPSLDTSGKVGVTTTVRLVVHGIQPWIDRVFDFVVVVSTLSGGIETRCTVMNVDSASVCYIAVFTH